MITIQTTFQQMKKNKHLWHYQMRHKSTACRSMHFFYLHCSVELRLWFAVTKIPRCRSYIWIFMAHYPLLFVPVSRSRSKKYFWIIFDCIVSLDVCHNFNAFMRVKIVSISLAIWMLNLLFRKCAIAFCSWFSYSIGNTKGDWTQGQQHRNG